MLQKKLGLEKEKTGKNTLWDVISFMLKQEVTSKSKGILYASRRE